MKIRVIRVGSLTNDSWPMIFAAKGFPRCARDYGKTSAMLLARPVDLRLLKFFRQLRFVQLLEVPYDVLIIQVGGDLGIYVCQKGDQLVALPGRKPMQKHGKGLGITAAVIGQDMLQAAGGVGPVLSIFA